MSNSIITGIVAIFDRDNIDTDQIIPTEYLKSIKKYVLLPFLLWTQDRYSVVTGDMLKGVFGRSAMRLLKSIKRLE